jgi:type II secretory pathway pseudopilin PulG
MPSGDRRPQRGLGYLGLLLLLAVLGATLAQLGTVWSTQAQRSREAELRFRGEQIQAAIARYRAAREPAEWPPTLEALLDDRRDGAPRHHLRRLWPDPFTGAADWERLPAPAPEPGVAGVRSRSTAPRLATAGSAAGSGPGLVSDWTFVHRAAPGRGPTTNRSGGVLP